jgi:glycosyltransferase involved in cell wall biosynthesis
VNVPVDLPAWRGTSLFDLKCVRHAARYRDLTIVFGYNTAIFNIWQRLIGTPMVFNMDGIEWSRARWSLPLKAVLYVNERVAAAIGHHLIADHPEIEKYLWTRAPKRKVTMVAYGADEVTEADETPVRELGLEPGGYLSLICRPVPENSILELVQGFSARPRPFKLAILGDYDPVNDDYHRKVVDAASEDVVFLGAIFDPDVVQPLRFHSAMYLHGHTVGGTNPSLVEALGAGNPVLAHDNRYNRWTAGDGQAYFSTAEEAEREIDRVAASQERLAAMSAAARDRYRNGFTWHQVAEQYRVLLERHLPQQVR